MLWPALNEWETDRSSGQKTFRGTCKIQRLFALPSNNASSFRTPLNNSATTETQMDWLFSWGNVTHCGSWRKDDRGERFQIKLVTTNKTTINCQPRNRCYNGTIPFFISYNCGQKSFFFLFFGTVIVKSTFWRASCTLNRATMTRCLQARSDCCMQFKFCSVYIFTHCNMGTWKIK